MTGFFFANRHSREFAQEFREGTGEVAHVVMEGASRGLLPSLRRNDYEISGRHGTVDFGGETNDTRQIPVNITLVCRDEATLRELAHEVAFWLRGKGLLFFDDNPARAFDAVVYESVDAEELIAAKRATVVFECQPFAKTINFLQSINPSIASGHTVDIFSNGTQPTPTSMIIMQNTGGVAITGLKIIRRALHR